jgi:hypothetical protein
MAREPGEGSTVAKRKKAEPKPPKWEDVAGAQSFADFLNRYGEWGPFRAEDLCFFLRASIKSVYAWKQGNEPTARTMFYVRSLLTERRNEYRDLVRNADELAKL